MNVLVGPKLRDKNVTFKRLGDKNQLTLNSQVANFFTQ